MMWNSENQINLPSYIVVLSRKEKQKTFLCCPGFSKYFPVLTGVHANHALNKYFVSLTTYFR